MFQKRQRWCFTGWPPPLLPPSRRRGSWPLGAPQPPACHQPERHGRAQSPGAAARVRPTKTNGTGMLSAAPGR